MNVNLLWALAACVTSVCIVINGYCAVNAWRASTRWINTVAVVLNLVALAFELHAVTP